jgi:hypothetical protein
MIRTIGAHKAVPEGRLDASPGRSPGYVAQIEGRSPGGTARICGHRENTGKVFMASDVDGFAPEIPQHRRSPRPALPLSDLNVSCFWLSQRDMSHLGQELTAAEWS